MASLIEQIIPRMFHRRLLLLMVVMIGATAALGAQLVRLTVVEHDRYAAEADAALVRRRLVATRRGRILDRKQRVLAEDRPCFDIAVDYDVITGERAYRLARKQAWRDYRDRWGSWSFDEREAVIADYRAPIDASEQRLWTTIREVGGLSEAELEAQRRTIVSRVQAIRQDVWQRKAKRREEELGGPIELSNIEVEIAEEREAHTILAAVSDEVKNRFSKLAQADPDLGMRVVNAKARHYPFGAIEVALDRSTLPSVIRSDKPQTFRVDPTALVLGGIRRQIWEEDVDPEQGGRPFRKSDGSIDLGGYLPGDSIGIGGVEQAEEVRLRGLRGQVLVRKDTGEESRQVPEFGQDVTLSIDVMLQARLRAIMEPSFGLMQVQGWHGNTHQSLGTPLSGAAVVMEVDTGEILAMISTPAPAAEGTPRAPTITEMLKDPMRPLVNRAISAVYPPGSTLKPIVYCDAVRQKRLVAHQQIDCRGHLLPNRPDLYRCWTWRPEFGRFGFHGPIGADEALARSCNIFFYETGERLKADHLISGLHGWGFGRTPGVGLAGEASGVMPSLDGDNVPGRELTVSNARLMAIGQGPIAVSPMQVAAAHTALARGGYYMAPLLIRERATQQQQYDLALPPAAVETALRGMRDVVEASYGTAHHLSMLDHREPIVKLEGVTLRAKTGTAQAPKLFDASGHLLRQGDHSWFVCHVQKPKTDRAQYVVVVVVEYGGSGGRVSGPVANQIVHALKAEGYL